MNTDYSLAILIIQRCSRVLSISDELRVFQAEMEIRNNIFG